MIKDLSDIKNTVVLVDKSDNAIGTMGKLDAHEQGQLHRAVSVFIFNSKDELLLQKRASNKYHSSGLWTNTACTHPYPGEKAGKAAARRLFEEMGIQSELYHGFSFVYHANLENNLVEHEYDHVYIGMTDITPKINPEEVEDWKYISENEIKKDLKKNPETFTSWFKLCYEKAFECLKHTTQKQNMNYEQKNVKQTS